MAKSFRYDSEHEEEALYKESIQRDRRIAARHKESRRVETLSFDVESNPSKETWNQSR